MDKHGAKRDFYENLESWLHQSQTELVRYSLSAISRNPARHAVVIAKVIFFSIIQTIKQSCNFLMQKLVHYCLRALFPFKGNIFESENSCNLYMHCDQKFLLDGIFNCFIPQVLMLTGINVNYNLKNVQLLVRQLQKQVNCIWEI